MISGLRLENFKCFDALDLALAPLTLLTGFNAAGKSTALQTILLLAQTMRTQEVGSELRLNGPLLNLGSAGDIINQDAGGSQLALGVRAADTEILWSFGVNESNDRRTLNALQLRVDANGQTNVFADPARLQALMPRGVEIPSATEAVRFIKQTIFISAARQVDTDVFPVPYDTQMVPFDVGPIGQYAAWWFHQCDDQPINEKRRLKGFESAETLRAQVNAWANDFFPGAEVNAQPIPKTNLMRLELRTGRTSEWRRPSNTGFGITYAFPVLVAGMLAAPGQTLIVDSPEAHLHPKGQSRIGYFLAKVAAAGVQILIETHSDHVLNGIRLALRDQEIDPPNVAIYFFGSDGRPQVTRLTADEKGALNQWPDGFFDQSEKDLSNLAGWI